MSADPPHFIRHSLHRPSAPGWLLLCAASICGCSLLSPADPAVEKSTLKLPPLVAPRDSVQLEILFVDRPRSDSLLGPALWNSIDEIAGLSAEQRAQLKEHGWRMGHVSSHPPRALEELLALTTDQPEVIDSSRRMVGRRVAVAAGSDVPVEITDLMDEFQTSLAPEDDPRTYTEARCVLRVRVDREQDGWVRLNFQPEIHHGRAWLQPVATPFDWTRQNRQNIDPLYDQQFSINLNVGEMAIVTAEGQGNEVIGQKFFRSLDESGRLQRLLIIRVADMRRLTPVYQD